jgi:hypothetical protein
MLPELFNTPVEVSFNGRVLKMMRLTNEDLGEFEWRVKEVRLERLRADQEAGRIPKEFYEPLFLDLYKEELLVFDTLRALTTAVGAPIGLWLCLRKHQPELTLEEVRRWPMSILQDTDLGAEYLRINMLTPIEKDKKKETETQAGLKSSNGSETNTASTGEKSDT